MLHSSLLLLLALLFATFLLVMLGQKLGISYPIFLVLGGLGISFVPGLPEVRIAPEVIFLVFLPPLLYEGAWYIPWHDFWRWRRPIMLLAFGLVVFTSGIVAVVAHWLIPGFTLALGFLLGGIISPPDAVAAATVLKDVSVPKRITSIVEGEGLLNDASSLIVFQFALAAVVSGTFVWQQAAVSFLLVAGGGLAVGLVVAGGFYIVHKYLPTTANINTVLTFMTPYVMYLLAEELKVSGVLAVVSGGLLMSYFSHRVFDANTRLQANSSWSSLVFMLNALVFMLIGLQLPIVVNGLGNYSLWQAIIYGLIMSGVVIGVRLLWVYPGAFLPRWLSRSVRASEPSPGWQGPLVLGWAGMRGVVSLAAALSVPLLANGQAFPQRNLILFITFVVILVTLVVQGLTLPLIVRFTKVADLEDRDPLEEQEASVRLHLRTAAVKYMQKQYRAEIQNNELVARLQQRMETEVSLTSHTLNSLDTDKSGRDALRQYHRVLLDVLRVEREALTNLRHHDSYDDEVLRQQEAQLDLDEAKVKHIER
ncbi:Na+/H+ antiporter [Hymenobacter artigasi]|uniref:CPA1 family monovalent cation:H+ antiporter n=1 Tax=Hymenobacter artigasi TaxID=2719616 RepID=A0ABX1HKS0_9BACT|nr:Na+/H+ antiporter [Hymenobacter artigasi]NKI90837.1 CPA1 family monovalent cation:H+ antiporter [Hymenobacter artigasi]